MLLNVKRDQATNESQPGKLYIDGEFFCYTLERHPNDPDHPCIAPGEFALTINEPTHNDHLWTPYPDRFLPRLQDVPNRSGILMHAGNKAADSIGCILCGYDRVDQDHIGRSQVAVRALTDKLRAAGEPIRIKVEDA